MRLASKIFLTSSLVVVVLALVGALGLRAVGQLVSVNREITTRAVPAVRLGAELRSALRALGRLEARYVILRDPRYAVLWDERANRFDSELEQLQRVVTTAGQREALAQVAAAFADYRRAVAQQRALVEAGQRTQAMQLVDTDGSARLERVEVTLDAMASATGAAVLGSLAEATRLEGRTWTGVLVALGAAVALSLAGTAFIAYRMTRSLRRLSAATAAVVEGSFQVPIDVKDRDEVGELARSFNAMAAELRQIDRMKEEFFATISHDLRSPLASVAEASYLLRDEVAGPLTPKQARLVAIITSSSQRVLGLVNRILELARLRAGVLPLERTPVDLTEVVARAVEELRPQAESAEVSVTQRQSGERFEIVGDEAWLVQVAVNLLGNAIRYTPKGGAIDVDLVDAGHEVRFVVEDTGIGIPPSAISTLFEPYRQAHRDRGGSGLGLAIVRGVAEAHGGRVTVESTEGKGSRFTVTLPRQEADA